MVLNSETQVFGLPNTNEVNLRISSNKNKFFGLGFPVGGNINSGYFSKMSGNELIKRNITQLIRTRRGERFMLPLFGTNLKKYLFEPIDGFLTYKIRQEIQETMLRYAPFVEVVSIEISSNNKNEAINGIEIVLSCKVKDEPETVFDISLGLI
jgi:phage baseplate assembly protein W